MTKFYEVTVHSEGVRSVRRVNTRQLVRMLAAVRLGDLLKVVRVR